MFTPKTRRIPKNFHLIQSMINYPIHYKINNFAQEPNDTNNYLLMESYKKIENMKINSLSKYIKNKNKRKMSLIKKIQRDKIDIFINKAFDKNNYNIRDYNYKHINTNILKLKPISNITKESIKDNVIYKYNNILGNKNPFAKSPPKENKDLLWSQKILEKKKLKDYRRFYSIKYMKIDNNLKYTVNNLKKSYNIVNNFLKEKHRNNKTYSKINIKKF